MTLEGEQTPKGIGVLKVLCLLACLFALVDVAFGILGIRPPLYATRYAIPESAFPRVVWDGIGLLCAPLVYAIQRRLTLAWKLGWVVLVAYYLWVVAETLASVLKTEASEPDRWIASAAVTIGFSIVAAYWLRWWNRQESYFSRRR